MSYYTIKSVSDDGTYYLVNHWSGNDKFWQKFDEVGKETLFSRESDAKRSLTRLLKVMPDYLADDFEMVEVRYSDWRDGFVATPLYKVEYAEQRKCYKCGRVVGYLKPIGDIGGIPVANFVKNNKFGNCKKRYICKECAEEEEK